MRGLILFVACLALTVLPACGDKDEGDGKQPNPPVAKGGASDGGGGGGAARADATGGSALGADLEDRIAQGMKKGRAFLLARQVESGAFGEQELGDHGKPNVAFTCMAVGGLLATTDKLQVKSDESIRKALAYLAGNQKPNGAIFDAPQLANYLTSGSVSAFAMARIRDFADNQRKARQYLVKSQIAGDENDLSYGAFPYKQDQGQTADLSNTQMAVQAVADDGEVETDSEFFKRLRVYLQRAQNRSESNKIELEIDAEGETIKIVSGDDGGAGYGPGMSKAGRVKRSDGRWEVRSYGSMTYALLKCLLLAGVGAEDPRVKAVVKWISDNWTVDRNPGFEGDADPDKAGQQGFFYYLYTAARALADYERLTGKPLVVTDERGRPHNWRREIATKLLSLQAADGSWQNKVDRWEEGSRVIVTGYALQALGFLTGRLP